MIPEFLILPRHRRVTGTAGWRILWLWRGGSGERVATTVSPHYSTWRKCQLCPTTGPPNTVLIAAMGWRTSLGWAGCGVTFTTALAISQPWAPLSFQHPITPLRGTPPWDPSDPLGSTRSNSTGRGVGAGPGVGKCCKFKSPRGGWETTEWTGLENTDSFAVESILQTKT